MVTRGITFITDITVTRDIIFFMVILGIRDIVSARDMKKLIPRQIAAVITTALLTIEEQ